ncbi:MAG: hypothetical protein NVS3B20_16760 [Polyangiales bacterium]
MNRITRSELLSLGEYEQIREHFRARIIELKRIRRVFLGDEISMVFENHDTLLWQVQEMLRTERITGDAAIAHELDTYNELMPGASQLSATLFIEIPDPLRRNEMLERLCAIEEHVSLAIGPETCRATFEEGRRDRGRAAAVQYLKFPLSARAISLLTEGRMKAAIVLDHPAFSARFELTQATTASLSNDLSTH